MKDVGKTRHPDKEPGLPAMLPALLLFLEVPRLWK